MAAAPARASPKRRVAGSTKSSDKKQKQEKEKEAESVDLTADDDNRSFMGGGGGWVPPAPWDEVMRDQRNADAKKSPVDVDADDEVRVIEKDEDKDEDDSHAHWARIGGDPFLNPVTAALVKARDAKEAEEKKKRDEEAAQKAEADAYIAAYETHLAKLETAWAEHDRCKQALGGMEIHFNKDHPSNVAVNAAEMALNKAEDAVTKLETSYVKKFGGDLPPKSHDKEKEKEEDEDGEDGEYNPADDEEEEEDTDEDETDVPLTEAEKEEERKEALAICKETGLDDPAKLEAEIKQRPTVFALAEWGSKIEASLPPEVRAAAEAEFKSNYGDTKKEDFEARFSASKLLVPSKKKVAA